MDMEDKVRDAILYDLTRQAELPDARLKVEKRPEGHLVVSGDVDLEELAMAVVGAVAGGP
ncbi:hypothetical protein [Caulobacter sp. 17J65-9]|uniref:hypothetical protein n=1 Tax=Caulobacter sp. 17J65-9 TaxID=2709382 RepID=UPI0013CC13D8|nr:hypothetical protein [Caulobacter sp. 17J65-9]NEX91524.1 hypothetical protein [Caulobacter sp. 17J65-9]